LRPADLALVGAGLTIFVLALGALAGVALAAALFGGGWVWPDGVAGAARELGALVAGRPGHGVPAGVAHRLPGAVALWLVVALVELAGLSAGILFARWAAQVVRVQGAGSGSAPGSASAHEVAAALGRRRRPLRRALRLVGPRSPADSDDPSWPLGRSRRVDLWVPYDRTVGVIGPSGAGRTLDVVAHAELGAPGPLVQVSGRPDDVLLTLTRRGEGGRPVAVFDPLGAVPGLPPLTWDPLRGCVDSTVATRRAKAFCAGTVSRASADGGDETAAVRRAPTGGAGGRARANAAEAAKVLQCYLHAAALSGRTIDHVLTWVADPAIGDVPEKILREHPHAQQHWADLLRGALRDSPPVATLQQAMDPLLHKEIAARCLPGARRPATDVADVLARNGTIYLLGKDDPVVSVSPLLTALADDVLDAAPPGTVVVIDDLPNTPVPAPSRPVVWTAPSREGLAACYGGDTSRAVVNAADVLVYVGAAATGELERRGIRRPLQDGEAVVVASPAGPFVARLRRVVGGRRGAELLAHREQARAQAAAAPDALWHARRDPDGSALAAARERGLHPDSWRST
jgi:type IV secretion system protein VirD4